MTVQRILDDKGDRLITVTYTENIGTITKILSAERIGSVILTDDRGELVGILSERDIVRLFAENYANAVNMPASEILPAIAVSPTRASSVLDAPERLVNSPNSSAVKRAWDAMKP